ncbi:hypothetical protein [Chitinophaga japonensis]|uniref:Uncharacterized protein n=1 Tax=Chitinophaga japonensis TaxID=104662 RepID=A0A562TC06_CHIJA|nr:hypothetical protein [Chitinophaga japonensis]TWI91042.1 hypothetical protein LX66_0403 [Chitinophaga japonensis]
MKKTALISLLVGALIAILSYIATEANLLGVKTFFKIGFTGLGLMILAAGYFMISFLLEWAKDTEFFKKIL